MKGVYSHAWLQSFFDEVLPSPETVQQGLLKHAFEVEQVVSRGGDTVYELDILPNRAADCLSHYGIAKEVAGIFSLNLAKRYFTEPFPFVESAEYIQTDACDRYTILKVENILANTISKDIRDRLISIGQRSINPIVDLSNYILFDIGQPIHVFDARKVSGAFGVRYAKDGETLVLIGGELVTLSSDDLVITDADRVVALAGIKGGEDTMADEHTRDVYIEIATFHGPTIRRSMQRLHCVTDASLRFSQGIPPEFIGYTTHRVAEVFGSCGTITTSIESRRVPLRAQRKTGFSVREVNHLLGTSYTKEDVGAALSRLYLPYTYINPRKRFLEVAREQVGAVYKWGASVTRDAPAAFDCSSFVCWCAAQAGKSIPRISINQYLSAEPVRDPKPGDLLFMQSEDSSIPLHTEHVYEAGYPVSPGTVERGINHVAILLDETTIIEAEGKSGANAVVQKDFDRDRFLFAARIFDDEDRFVVTVPIERPDVLHVPDCVEEVGRMLGYDSVPTPKPDHLAAAPRNKDFVTSITILQSLRDLGFSEVVTRTFCKEGEVCVVHPVAEDKGCLRDSLRQGIEESLAKNAYYGELLGVPDIRIMEIGAVFSGDREEMRLAIGVTETVGRPPVNRDAIAEEIRQVLTLPGGFDGAVWEVPLSAVSVASSEFLWSSQGAPISYSAPSPYPFALRDVAVFVPDGGSAAQTEELLKTHGGLYLRRINLFDSFVKDGKQSYAFRLVFQSDERTLDDGVVNATMDILYAALQDAGYVVR